MRGRDGEGRASVFTLLFRCALVRSRRRATRDARSHTHRRYRSLHTPALDACACECARREKAHRRKGIGLSVSRAPSLHRAPTMDAYTKGETLGSGTFGVVYKATHKEVTMMERGASERFSTSTRLPSIHVSLFISPFQTGKVVAVKKIRLGNAKEVRKRERKRLWPSSMSVLSISQPSLLSHLFSFRASPSPPSARSRSCVSSPTRTWWPWRMLCCTSAGPSAW